MSNKKTQSLPYQRKAYLVQCNHSSHNRVHLDFKSALGAEWVAKWVQLHGGLKVPLSGVIRRALEVYMKHLEQLPPERAAGEVQGVKYACQGTRTPPDEQEAAEARLEASSEVLPSFAVVLLGPYEVAARAAMLKHLEQFDHIPPSRAAALKKEPQP